MLLRNLGKNLFIIVLVSLLVQFSCTTIKLEQKLDLKVKEWYELHSAIMLSKVPKSIDRKQPEEWRYFLNLTPRLQKLYIGMFWIMRDPDAKKEFTLRVSVANYWFRGEGCTGWQTDMGWLMLRVGQPDYEDWKYLDNYGRLIPNINQTQEEWDYAKTRYFRIWKYWIGKGLTTMAEFTFQYQINSKWKLLAMFNDFNQRKLLEVRQQETAPTDEGWQAWAIHVTKVYKPEE